MADTLTAAGTRAGAGNRSTSPVSRPVAVNLLVSHRVLFRHRPTAAASSSTYRDLGRAA